jgi:Ser/Thr protein kinase RdoA (MazF antagonist)
VGEGLPRAFTHPDFGPANALRTADGETVLVDWTGAGSAPRILGLGVLLSGTGGNETLIGAAVDGYRSRIDLDADELGRLVDAVRGFGLVLNCWGIVFFGTPPSHVVLGLPFARSAAEAVAAATRRALAAPSP